MFSLQSFALENARTFICHDDNSEPGYTVQVTFGKDDSGYMSFENFLSYVALPDQSHVSEIQYGSNARPQLKSDGSVEFYGYSSSQDIKLILQPAAKSAVVTFKKYNDDKSKVETLILNCVEL